MRCGKLSELPTTIAEYNHKLKGHEAKVVGLREAHQVSVLMAIITEVDIRMKFAGKMHSDISMRQLEEDIVAVVR